MTVSGIGKYRLVNGLSMSWAGTRYVVLAYFCAPNDQVGASGNPIEMTLVYAPVVPEEPRSLARSGVPAFWLRTKRGFIWAEF